MAPMARGVVLTATLPFAMVLLEGFEQCLWAGEKIRPAGGGGHLSGGHGVPSVRIRDGGSVTLSHADTEGPRHRTRYWVAVE